MTVIYVDPTNKIMLSDLLAGECTTGDVLTKKIFCLKDFDVGISGNAFHVPVGLLNDETTLQQLIAGIQKPKYALRTEGNIGLLAMPRSRNASDPCLVFNFFRDALVDDKHIYGVDYLSYVLFDGHELGVSGLSGALRFQGMDTLIKLKDGSEDISAILAYDRLSAYHFAMGIVAPPQFVVREGCEHDLLVSNFIQHTKKDK